MDATHLILGGGLAGLGLAVGLREAGVRGPIVVLERHDGPRDDRTWCTWQAGPTPLADLAVGRWEAWEVCDGRGGRALARAPRTPYLRLPGLAVQEHQLGRAHALRVDVHFGVRVLGVDDPGRGALTVHTTAGELRAAHVHDALALGGPLGRARRPGGVELHQRFLGWDVEVEHPVFDPGVATLMDFGVDQAGAVRFLYVLPTSSTSALVEDTSLGGAPMTAGARRLALGAHLEARGAGAVEVVREERGDLLMTDGAFSAGSWPRFTAVGAAAGAVRPSSGYAFSRTMRHVGAVARALADGAAAPPPPGRTLLDRMDAVMLRVLAAEPARAPELFGALAAGVPGEAFARFMVDVPTARDLGRVVTALPPGLFARAALRPRGAALVTQAPGRRSPRPGAVAPV